MPDRAALLDALFNGATSFLNTLGEAGLELSRTENGRFRWRWHTLNIESVQTYPQLGEALEDALWFLTQPGAYETRAIISRQSAVEGRKQNAVSNLKSKI